MFLIAKTGICLPQRFMAVRFGQWGKHVLLWSMGPSPGRCDGQTNAYNCWHFREQYVQHYRLKLMGRHCSQTGIIILAKNHKILQDCSEWTINSIQVTVHSYVGKSCVHECTYNWHGYWSCNHPSASLALCHVLILTLAKIRPVIQNSNHVA